MVSPSTTRTTRPMDADAGPGSSWACCTVSRSRSPPNRRTKARGAISRRIPLNLGAAPAPRTPRCKATGRPWPPRHEALVFPRSLGDRGLLLLVDADEVQVLVGDLLGRGLAVEGLLQEALQRVPPDGAADGKADEALDRRRHAQPVLDLLVAGAAAQQHADDVLAARARARLAGKALGVLARVDALDLP